MAKPAPALHDPARYPFRCEIETRYRDLGHSHFPDPLELHISASRIANSSYELCQLAMQQGDVVTFARLTMVSIKHGRPCAIPEALRDQAMPWMMRP